MIIRRLSAIIESKLYQGKAIILIGARQVGKTTLLKQLETKIIHPVLFLNCDEPDVRQYLTQTTSSQLRQLFGSHKVVMIDEAQRVQDIGLTLKLIIDQLPQVQLLVSGSSTLELANQINEPLTGRKYEYYLYPLAYSELCQQFGLLEESRLLEERLIYGTYPDIVMQPENKLELLTQLASSYLYKDVFNYQEIRKPELLQLLLEALALQLGSEVSYHELAQMLGSDRQTIRRYIDLLEKAVVIFRLRAFSRNVRNELKKSRKIYFYDNGIRNALIRHFNPLALRVDTGALWENYLVAERMKRNAYNGYYCHSYFWRTRQQQEIDYLEEYGGRLFAYEFKWNPRAKAKFPKTFIKAYPDSQQLLITPENFQDFLSSE